MSYTSLVLAGIREGKTFTIVNVEADVVLTLVCLVEIGG